MDKPIDKNSFWLQLGPLIGPIMIYCLLLVILVRTTETSIIIPLVAFGGLICSHIFRWKGVVIASLSLSLALIFHFLHEPSSTWAWTITLSLSAVSSFVVTVLCCDASANIMDKLITDLKDYKNTITHLGDRLSDGHRQLLNERNEMASQYGQSIEKLEKAEMQVQSLERKVQLVTEEIKASHIHQEKIQQILYDTRQQNAILSDAFAAVQESGNFASPGTFSARELAQVCELQKELQIAQKNCLDFESQLQDSLILSKNHEEKIKSLEEEILDLQSVNSLLKSQEHTLTSSLLAQEHASSHLEQELQESMLLSRAHEEKIEALVQKNLDLHTANSLMQEQKQKLIASLHSQEDISSQLALKLQESTISIKEHEEKIDGLVQKILDLHTANNLSQEQEQKLTSTLLEKERFLSQLEDKLQEAVALNKQQEADIEVLMQEISDLQTVNDLCKAEEHKLTSALHAKDQNHGTVTSDLELKIQESVAFNKQCEEKIKILSQEVLDLQAVNQLSKEQEHKLFLNLQEQNAIIEEYKLHLQHLESEKLKRNEDLNRTSLDQASLNQDREIRRLNGLYNQLKDQFSEKSATLTATRKELFLSQEKLETFQRELEETKLQEDNFILDLLQNNLKQAESEIEQIEDEHLAEIARLEAIIHEASVSKVS